MKKLRFNIPQNLYLRFVAIFTFAIGLVAFFFYAEQESPETVFHLKIPPIFNNNQSNVDIRQDWLDYGFVTVPLSEIKERELWTNPYIPVFIVSVENDGRLKFTDDYLRKVLAYKEEDVGTLDNTEVFSANLKAIFRDRTRSHITEENSSKIVKKVMIRASRSTKYSDVIKLIDVVKESGATPIILQIDELPQ